MSDAELEHGEGEAVPQAQADGAGGAMPKRKPLGNISPPKPFQMVGSADTIAENWKLWKTTWNIYEIVAQLSDFDVEYQVAVLLHTLGPEAMKVYSTMEFLSDENRDVKTILSKFDTFTIGEANETYERYIFNNRVQSETESFDEYLTAIRTLSQTCNFCNCLKDSLLRDRIVTGIRDAQTRKRLLQDSKLTLNTCIAVCRSAEATSARLKTMHTEDVHKVGKHKSKQGNKPVHVNREKKKPQEQKTQKCKFCAYSHVMDRRKCPAWGKTCSLCGEENHFKKCCKRQKRPVHTVDTDESEDSDSLEFISTVCVDHDTVELCNKVGKNKSSDIFAKMLLVDQDTTVDFQLDCGASVNILPRNCVKSKIEITPTQKVLRMWNGTLVHPDGVTRLIVRNPKNKKRYSVEFVVVSNAGCSLVPLLGAKAVQQMGLLTVNRDNFVPVNSVSRGDTVVNAEVKDDSSANAMRIINSYAENFGEIGTLPGKVHLYVKEDAQPVVSNQNRVPVSQREALKKELDRLVSQEVIAPVDVPTDWVSTLVIAQKKSGGMRICMDPKHLNEMLKREHYQLPTIEEILPDLSDAKVFSSCDLSHGFWHLELDHESSMLCTFATPFGRFRWKRLAFGLSVSPEIFQKRLHQALEGLPGVKCIVDDIIVYGRGDDKSVAQVDHDKNLEGLMQRCKSLGIKLNRGKLQLCRPEVSFLGHLLTEQGLKADPEKIKAVVDMPRPENVEDIQRFAGFVNYLARFLPHLSEVLQPLRKLTHGDVKWEWGDQEKKAFVEVKKLVTSAPVLAYYKERTKTLLPTTESLLKPRSVDTAAERSKLKSRQKKQKSYFDKTAKDLKPLNEGDVVRMKPFKMSNKVWRKATVLRRLDDRSYEVETDNGIVRRNRLHIRKSNEKSNVKDNIPAESYTPRKASSTSDVTKSPKSSEVPKRSADVPMTPRTLPVPDPICASPMLKTRSGHTVKPPGHLKDFRIKRKPFYLSSRQDLLFCHLALGDRKTGWAVDVVGQVWFVSGVTMETPLGDECWWQVPISEYYMQDVTAIDALRSLANKFDPQKLSYLLSTQRGGLLAVGALGVWMCPEYKNLLQVCRGTIEGHHWNEIQLKGLATSVAWKYVCAGTSSFDNGVMWIQQPNGDVFTFPTDTCKITSISRPSLNEQIKCLSVCKQAIWAVTESGKVYIRDSVWPHCPEGSSWVGLDLSQLGDVHLIHLSCGTLNIWAIDSEGDVFQRIGVKAPSSHSLNPAWLVVDSSPTGTVFTQVESGPQDWMVWAIDNRRHVFVRDGVTDTMPIGTKWMHVPGTPASKLTISNNYVWALTPSGEIMCRFGISHENPAGDYWKKIPGFFKHISVSHRDSLWAIGREGSLHHRQTKYIVRRDPMQDHVGDSSRCSTSSMGSEEGDWELV
ncbi:hypothetical protein ScPMuIL_013543 [Solemya velum]